MGNSLFCVWWLRYYLAHSVLCLFITLLPHALCFVFDYCVSTSRTLFCVCGLFRYYLAISFVCLIITQCLGYSGYFLIDCALWIAACWKKISWSIIFSLQLKHSFGQKEKDAQVGFNQSVIISFLTWPILQWKLQIVCFKVIQSLKLFKKCLQSNLFFPKNIHEYVKSSINLQIK